MKQAAASTPQLLENMRAAGYRGWFKSESRERRKKVRLDRKLLENRARRFLKSYLEADEIQKPHVYRAVEDISRKCHPAELGLDDSRIAETTSQAAIKMVLIHLGKIVSG